MPPGLLNTTARILPELQVTNVGADIASPKDFSILIATSSALFAGELLPCRHLARLITLSDVKDISPRILFFYNIVMQINFWFTSGALLACIPKASPGVYTRPESPRSISTLIVSLSFASLIVHKPSEATMVPKYGLFLLMRRSLLSTAVKPTNHQAGTYVNLWAGTETQSRHRVQ